MAQGSLHYFHVRAEIGGNGLKPSRFVESGDDLLSRTKKHQVGYIRRRSARGLGAHRRVLDEGAQLWSKRKRRPRRPRLSLCQHGRANYLDLHICPRWEENFPADRQPVYCANTIDGISGDRIDSAESGEGKRDFSSYVRLNNAKNLIVTHRLPRVVYVDHTRIKRRTLSVLVQDVGKIEHQARAPILVRRFLRKQHRAVHLGSGSEEQLAGFTCHELAIRAKRISDHSFNGVAGARAVAGRRRNQPDAKRQARRQVRLHVRGDSG